MLSPFCNIIFSNVLQLFFLRDDIIEYLLDLYSTFCPGQCRCHFILEKPGHNMGSERDNRLKASLAESELESGLYNPIHIIGILYKNLA